jgi:hypothetical protein
MNQSILASGVIARYLVAYALVIHEVAQSTVDRGWSEWSGWNTTGVDPLHMTIVLYGRVEELRILG